MQASVYVSMDVCACVCVWTQAHATEQDGDQRTNLRSYFSPSITGPENSIQAFHNKLLYSPSHLANSQFQNSLKVRIIKKYGVPGPVPATSQNPNPHSSLAIPETLM